MKWSLGHLVIIFLVFAAGLYIGVKKPSLVSTATGGLVSSG